jgi:transcription elongation GreA/GreB family factor
MTARHLPTARPATDSRAALTDDGRRMLEERLELMRTVSLPLLRPLLATPGRDERDVAEFERLTAEALRLDALLASAAPVPPVQDGTVGLGSRALVELPDGNQVWLRPVHPVEAFLDDERVSCESPAAWAVLGSRPGDEVTVDGPAGRWLCRVVAVDNDRAATADALGTPA